jgi:hypothetical protein
MPYQSTDKTYPHIESSSSRRYYPIHRLEFKIAWTQASGLSFHARGYVSLLVIKMHDSLEL